MALAEIKLWRASRFRAGQIDRGAWHRPLRRRLQGCGAHGCGQTRCVEVCAWADWRRRLQLIPAAHNLFQQPPTPVYEVKVVRGNWDQYAGCLRDISIPDIRRMSQRALKRLEVPNESNVIAVGTVKALIGTAFGSHWVFQLHLLAAGTYWPGLYGVLRAKRKTRFGSNFWAERVKDLPRTINSVFDTHVRGWVPLDEIPFTPTEAHREEFYQWLVGLRFGDALFAMDATRI